MPPMKYYGDDPWDDTTFMGTGSGMLASSDGIGKCQAWAELFRDAVKVQGISGAVRKDIWPDPTCFPTLPSPALWSWGILIHNYEFTPSLDIAPVLDPSTGLYSPAPEEGDGIAGQGASNPWSSFENHAVVFYDGEIYDVAYGDVFDGSGAGGSSLLEWQRTQAAGIGAQHMVTGDKLVWPQDATKPIGVKWDGVYP